MSILTFAQIVISSSLLLYTVISFKDNYGTDMYHAFNDYIQTFNKSYIPGSKEYSKRQNAFKESLKRIDILNKNEPTAIYGINEFSDLTPEEFRNYVQHRGVRSTFKPKKYRSSWSLEYSKKATLPTKVDWRDKSIISPIRNQFKCGACWAFSTVETIEAMYALKTGILEEWSVQQIIDCAPAPNEGCDGGDTCVAIDWLHRDNVNLVLEKDYPFTDSSGLCKIKRSEKTVKVASNFTCDSFIDEEYLMLYQLAYHGPLIVAVDATKWQDYVSGVISVNCGNERNHAVQIVGYNLSDGIPHYIVRNTWGTKFGDKGYLNIAFGSNACSIAEEVSTLDVI